jgi:uncharacterized protein (DUF2249 family)
MYLPADGPFPVPRGNTIAEAIREVYVFMKNATIREHDLSNVKKIDLRSIPEAERNLRVMQAFGSIRQHDEFCIVSDSDPMVLKRQFHLEMKDRFDWHELENGPNLWKILIVKRRRNNDFGK